jgi:hypothetical protein
MKSLMKDPVNSSKKTHSKKKTQRQRLRSSSALLIALLFFNFSVLNSSNCSTYRQVSQSSLAESPEIIITTEIAKKLKEDPHYLCKLLESSSQKAGSESLPGDAESYDCDFCYYCLIMLGGMAVSYSFPAIGLQIQPNDKEIYIFKQSVFVQPTRKTNSSRAPPFYC